MSDQDQVTGQDDPQVLDQSLPNNESSLPNEEIVESEIDSEVEESLPESASDRTRKEFEKLKEANRKLKEELDSQRGSQDDLSDYIPSHLTQRQTEEIQTNFVDQNGYVDVNALNRALKEANDRARRAEELALSSAKERERRMIQEAHEKHPYLDPRNAQHDREFYNAVRDRMVRYFSEGIEKPLSEVADEIARFYKPAITPEKVEAEKAKAVEAYQKSQTTRATVNTTTNQRREPVTDMDDLRARTRDGDSNALQERIRRAGL